MDSIDHTAETDNLTIIYTEPNKEEELLQPPVKPTPQDKLKHLNKKMASIMMITPPMDSGYRIVNEDGSEHKQSRWAVLHGNGNHFLLFHFPKVEGIN